MSFTLDSELVMTISSKIFVKIQQNIPCQYEAKIVIPKGEKLNIGKAAEQVDSSGNKYSGGGNQILMPMNWAKNHPEWIQEVRELKR